MKGNSHSVKINLFGVGACIVKGEFDEVMWKRFFDCSKEIRSSFDQAVFDPFFFEALEMTDYKSFYDFGNAFRLTGLLHDGLSHIEIRINGRQRRRILFKDILGENSLFPVCQTSVQQVEHLNVDSQRSIIGVEKEMGTVASYKFECTDFSLDKLQIVLHKINIAGDMSFTILSKIGYDGKGLLKIHSDTVVTERFAFYDRSVKSAVA